jgi:aspartate kinase
MAKRYHVNLEVLSSFTGKPGTKVKEVVKKMEKSHVSGVAKDKNIARLALVGLRNEPGIAFHIFSLLAQKKINVDIILQSIGRNEEKDISFTVTRSDLERAGQILEERKDSLGYERLEVNDHVAKVSIVGAGMIGNPGVAANMFEALFNAGININMISTSEIKVSVLVDERDADRAVQAVHDKFFTEYGR